VGQNSNLVILDFDGLSPDKIGILSHEPTPAQSHATQADSDMSKNTADQPESQERPIPHTIVTSQGGFISTGMSAKFEVSPRTRITLDLPPEAAQALNELMSRTRDTPSDLFRKALGLYALAEEAKREGKAVGIAATPDCLETDFVGL
jgi:hypothetical protein